MSAPTGEWRASVVLVDDPVRVVDWSAARPAPWHPPLDRGHSYRAPIIIDDPVRPGPGVVVHDRWVPEGVGAPPSGRPASVAEAIAWHDAQLEAARAAWPTYTPPAEPVAWRPPPRGWVGVEWPRQYGKRAAIWPEIGPHASTARAIVARHAAALAAAVATPPRPTFRRGAAAAYLAGGCRDRY